MRRWICVAAALACLVPTSGRARPVEATAHLAKPLFVDVAGGRDAAAGAGSSALSSGAAFNDTVCYGGTLVDGQPDPIPGAVPPVRAFKGGRQGGPGGGVWNFNTGIGSNFTEPLPTPKTAGYHHRMEGWYGLDNTYSSQAFFRRSTLCALNGSFSFYAGLSAAEANDRCYAAGQGYGNNWYMTVGKTFNYPGTGNVTLSYRYQVEAEPNFDYLNVRVDTTGSTPDYNLVALASYTGNIPATTATHTLVRGVTLRSTPGPVTIKFIAYADGGYSDQDGSYATTCGLCSVDNITLSGAITDVSDFETGPNGWGLLVPSYGVGGEWSDIRRLSSLPPPLSFCPCDISDSVLVFIDNSGAHQTSVDNIACSPWIDLKAGGDAGRPGKLIRYAGYFELPLTNYIFVQTLASWYPEICVYTGQLVIKPPTSDGFVRFFGGVPNCTAPGAPISIDFSGVIPPSAEQVKVCMGVLSYCNMFAECTGVTNTTPWLDKISLCVFGTPGAPIVNLRTIDTFQDNFAADGTLNPSSTGRIDTDNVKGAVSPTPGTTLGDTLLVNGDGGNQEVRVKFRVRPGPFTNAGALAAWAAGKWTAEPGLGAGWYSARLDSAEQGGTKSALKWMGTLHENDPKFGGGSDTDRGGEGDFNQLSHDIFPDHILTPGSRIDYFIQARYMPPDPRNPGGASWYVTPDTTGGVRLEVEILPSSMAADTTWNCTLYVDHHADRDFLGQRLEEQGLTAALGAGGNTPEGTRFDRYDVNAPSSNLASLGRPLRTQYGASIIQLFAYKAVAWHSSNLASFNLVDEDANILAPWLTITEVGGRRFWASGDGLARSISSENEPTTVSFLANVCGVRFGCDTIRLASCPAGSVLDSTYCLPLAPVAGAAFTTATPVNARGNGCPEIRSFDLLTRNSAISTSTGQLSYQKLDGVKAYAAITNYNTVDVDYKTVIDGVAVGNLRDPNGSTHNAARCNIQTPALARAQDVVGWFQSPTTFGLCDNRGTGIVAAPEAPAPPRYRTALGAIYPNPMNPTTRIAFTNGRAGGRLTLTVFDVTGRRVRQLLDGPRPAGAGEITWDGRDDEGRSVASGLYFVKLATVDVVQSRKLVVSK